MTLWNMALEAVFSALYNPQLWSLSGSIKKILPKRDKRRGHMHDGTTNETMKLLNMCFIALNMMGRIYD